MNAEMKARVKQLLIAGRARIKDEKNWAQGENVCSKEGRYCAATALLGWNTNAMQAREQLLLADRAAESPPPIAGSFSIADLFIYNDTHSHAEVLALYDKAITACEE